MKSYIDEIITPTEIELNGHFPSYGTSVQYNVKHEEPPIYLKNLMEDILLSRKSKHFDPLHIIDEFEKLKIRELKDQKLPILSSDDELHIKRCREYFEEQRHELYKEHYGEYIAICDENIIAISPTLEGLIKKTEKILKKKKLKHRPHLMRIGRDTAITSIRATIK